MVKLVSNNFLERKGVIVILVLFLCVIIAIVVLINFLIIFSTIRFRIEDFELANVKRIMPNYKVIISLKLFNKIKWLSLNLNNKKMKKIYTKLHLETIDIRKIEKDLKISDIKEFIEIKPKVTHLNLKLNVGADDVIITGYIIAIISSLIGIILPHITRKKDIKNIKYKIKPVYNMKNVYHLKLTTTLEIKVFKILSSAYKIHKSRKQKSDKMYKFNQFGTYYQYKNRIKES